MTRWRRLDADALRAWPLPAVEPDADKEARGHVLVVAGSREIAGAAGLAGVAALRAGAGKLAIATGESAASTLAVAVPEARVFALPETPSGGLALDGLDRVAARARGAGAIVIGPGLMDEEATAHFTFALLARFRGVKVVLDATALKAIPMLGRFDEPVLVTPHAGEMASLVGCGKDEVQRDPATCAVDAARRWNAVVALKGAATLVALPGGEGWRHEGSQPGLATSGSGDVLAGLAAGLLARGATLEQAAAWAVVLHAQAGSALAARLGPVGFLARELADEVPAILRRLA